MSVSAVPHQWLSAVAHQCLCLQYPANVCVCSTLPISVSAAPHEFLCLQYPTNFFVCNAPPSLCLQYPTEVCVSSTALISLSALSHHRTVVRDLLEFWLNDDEKCELSTCFREMSWSVCWRRWGWWTVVQHWFGVDDVKCKKTTTKKKNWLTVSRRLKVQMEIMMMLEDLLDGTVCWCCC